MVSARRMRRAATFTENSLFRLRIQFFAREIKERTAQQREHENAEQIVRCEVAKQLRAEREKIGPPRESQHTSDPTGNVSRYLGILEKIDDDTEEAKDTSGGD